MTPWRWIAVAVVVECLFALALGRLLRWRGVVPVDHLSRPSAYPRPVAVTIDGSALEEGDTILRRSGPELRNNGIYVVTRVGDEQATPALGCRDGGLACDDDGEPWAPFRVR